MRSAEPGRSPQYGPYRARRPAGLLTPGVGGHRDGAGYRHGERWAHRGRRAAGQWSRWSSPQVTMPCVAGGWRGAAGGWRGAAGGWRGAAGGWRGAAGGCCSTAGTCCSTAGGWRGSAGACRGAMGGRRHPAGTCRGTAEVRRRPEPARRAAAGSQLRARHAWACQRNSEPAEHSHHVC